jgi:hypothetical protein
MCEPPYNSGARLCAKVSASMAEWSARQTRQEDGMPPPKASMYAVPTAGFNGGALSGNASLGNKIAGINETSISGPSVVGYYIEGTEDSDTLHGSSLADDIFGRGGHDVLYGALGNDNLDGGEGNDTLNGGAGGDRLVGGAGIDTASYAGSSAVTVDLLAAAVTLKVTLTPASRTSSAPASPTSSSAMRTATSSMGREATTCWSAAQAMTP